jgi:hypothetical protein
VIFLKDFLANNPQERNREWRFLEVSRLDFYEKIYTILGKDNFYFYFKSMITIPERIPPISSYKNIVRHPLAKEIFTHTISQL